ncbi:hypothetical protein [Bizionia arctica]|uniref:Uncharacterized protein n=1 Tax=Bizionia arctica TaxID=1495645 RepID=A0A917GX93_9FLAO|nr:hypothetical protein [Bizionia arctica]GGG60438.1 hypothetical protein GCM10010976_34020 [Bizionia arctica]
MKLINILIFLIIVSLSSCKSKPEQSKKNYELITENDGILIEKFDSTIVDENKYNQNNIIYKVGNSFKYKFEHITQNNDIKFFNLGEDNNSWEFVDFENSDSTTIKSVKIQVANGNPMADHVPDYNQTVLMYKFEQEKTFSMSGAIENEGNVWIHPPRDKYFEILELNPFPYIKAPYEIGTKWTWNLGIGDHWSDERWKIWEGQIENTYEYEITDKRTLKTDLGNIECFVIEAKAKSKIGQTKLTAYFNTKYGFVKLEYTNIDESKTNLELIEYSE